MYRYKLTIEYDGTNFSGFQKQKGLITVQEVLEKAISNLANKHTEVFCAGRTDTGVHATGQVIHFDLIRYLSNEKIKLAINYHLKPFTVAVVDAENLGENSTFHARFSAKERYYEYKILEQTHPPTFNANLYLWQHRSLNHTAMQQAANLLIGKHDFSSFRSSICSAKSPIKTINEILINKENNMITIDVKARSFLHHQVRFIVGALLKVGLGKWTKDDVLKVLLAKDNTKNAALAAAHGLYLKKVIY